MRRVNFTGGISPRAGKWKVKRILIDMISVTAPSLNWRARPAPTKPAGVGRLLDFLALRDLSGYKERLYQLAFPADGHARKTLEPFVVRRVRFLAEPSCQQSQLIGGDAALFDTVEQS